MDKCQGCHHIQERNKIMMGGLVWGSTQPHPCITCQRFPSKKEEMPDNFAGGKLTTNQNNQ